MIFLIFASLFQLLFRGPSVECVQAVDSHQSHFEQVMVKDLYKRPKLLPEAFSTSRLPNRITVKDTPIDLAVEPAGVIGNNYDFFSEAASFLEISSVPGEGGNVVMYAHNEPELFSALHQTSLGQEIVVNTSARPYRYTITEKKVVEPNDISVIQETGSEQLTLLTCTGVKKSHRLIVIAEPLKDFGKLLLASSK